MYDSAKDMMIDEALAKHEVKHEPYTKEMQLNHGRIKPKKESTFGKPKAGATFGKAGKQKEKNNDIIDDAYSAWLGTQACVITGRKSKRGVGVDNMHCHHIDGRNGIRNDYEQVPLMGYVHSWGAMAYHNNTKKDFIAKNMLIIEDIKEFFHDCANELLKKYVKEGGVLNEKYKQKDLNN